LTLNLDKASIASLNVSASKLAINSYSLRKS
jgi:hypothetical protein